MLPFVVIVIVMMFCMALLFYREDYPKNLPKLNRIYYINLDRRPDRKEHVLKQMKQQGFDMTLVERFRAIDGDQLQLTPQQKRMFLHSDYRRHQYSSSRDRIMANQLSHYSILQDMVKKNYEYILILQDDVVFKKGFLKHLEKVMNNIPEDAEIVNIGSHKEAFYAHFVPMDLENEKENNIPCMNNVNDVICKIHQNTNPCSLAYIVTKKGAINLIEYFEKTGFLRETDLNYNEYLASKNINYASKEVLCTGALMGSDIFIEPLDHNKHFNMMEGVIRYAFEFLHQFVNFVNFRT